MKVNVTIYAWDGTMFDMEWEGYDLSKLFEQVRNFYDQLDSDYPSPRGMEGLLGRVRKVLLGREPSWEQRKVLSKTPITGRQTRMKRACDRNPQLPPHEHHRKDGSLVCEGYIPATKQPLIQKVTEGYVSE